MQPLAMILFATGTNRDNDVAQALTLAGARTEIVPLNRLRRGERRWDDYQMLVLPGGFSYADALGAGKLLSLDLEAYFAEAVSEFVAQGKPVIGICNGFQALVKSGILPGQKVPAQKLTAGLRTATLTFNRMGHFECRWVTLAPQPGTCIWTSQLAEPIYCPVAHGEGNFVTANQHEENRLCEGGQVALRYAMPDGSPVTDEAYPYNPNGSVGGIAGICNPTGNVLGLMPHPENHIFDYQHPRRSRGESHGSGLPLFINGVQYAAQFC
jgi:phosphoribosylformylglycinamidine synthase subunit PurQ / glutaminase